MLENKRVLRAFTVLLKYELASLDVWQAATVILNEIYLLLQLLLTYCIKLLYNL